MALRPLPPCQSDQDTKGQGLDAFHENFRNPTREVSGYATHRERRLDAQVEALIKSNHKLRLEVQRQQDLNHNIGALLFKTDDLIQLVTSDQNSQANAEIQRLKKENEEYHFICNKAAVGNPPSISDLSRAIYKRDQEIKGLKSRMGQFRKSSSHHESQLHRRIQLQAIMESSCISNQFEQNTFVIPDSNWGLPAYHGYLAALGAQISGTPPPSETSGAKDEEIKRLNSEMVNYHLPCNERLAHYEALLRKAHWIMMRWRMRLKKMSYISSSTHIVTTPQEIPMSDTVNLADHKKIWLPMKEDFDPTQYSVNESNTNIQDMISFDGYLWQNPYPLWRNEQELVAGIFRTQDGRSLMVILPRKDVLTMKEGSEFLRQFDPELREFNKKYHVDGIRESAIIATKALTILWNDGNQQRLDAYLREQGFFLFNVSTIIPLDYDYYEVMVDATKIDKLREQLRGLTYAPFDSKSTLVRKMGEHGALRIMLESYRRANLREEPRKLAESRMKELEKGLVQKTELSIYSGGPGKILESGTTTWDQRNGNYHVLAVLQTPDGKRLRAKIPVDTYARSENAKALAGPEWAVIIRHVSWGTWLQLPFLGIINAMGLY
uniref:Uncharacterized protein n=1 Tax=Talaromyces marneffei PM1 TaxID=1077442 RepID=A0A093UQI7_TALMA